MSLVPFTFPLLKLPLLAIHHVADFWNPLEIYKISLISKKANSVAKLVSQKANSIYLNDFEYINVTVRFPNSDLFYQFCPCKVQSQKKIEEDDENETGTSFFLKLFFFSRNPARDAWSTTEHLVELFKCRSFELSIWHGTLPFAYIQPWLNWFNPFRITEVYYLFKDDERMRVFFENFRSPYDELHIGFCKENQLKVPERIDFEWPSYIKIFSISPLNIPFLTRIDAPNLDVYCSSGNITESLRDFLKSWQTGMTNSNLKTATFQMQYDVILEKILEGTSTEYRTLKRFIRNNHTANWVCKEADIEGPNGKIATVQSRTFALSAPSIKFDNNGHSEPTDREYPLRQCYIFVR